MKKLIPVLFVLGIFATACKKSKDAPPPPPPPLTKENVAGAYKITGDVSTSPDGTSTTDNYANYQPCAKDDIWNFNADNSLAVTDEGVVCDPSGSWTSSWSLDGDAISVAGMNGSVTKWTGSIMEVTLLFDDGTKDKISFKKQ